MPDLTHRPTRYLTAAAAVVALTAGGASALDLQVQRGADMAAMQHQNKALQEQLRAVRAQQEQRQGVIDQGRVRAAAAHERRRAARARVLIARAAARQFSTTTTTTTTPRPGQPNCASFPHQEAAQQALALRPALRTVLDGDHDGRACEQLKQIVRPEPEPAPRAQRLAVAPPRVRPVAPSKAAIVASGRHFGLATATTEEFDGLERALGRDASLSGYFEGWNSGYDRGRVASSWQRGEIPVMTWESRNLNDPTGTDRTDYSLRRIVRGGFDQYLTRYARDVRALGLPVVIRLDQEMNGNWYRWAEFEDHPYDNKPGEFAAAWRHVHDIFQREGANRHVIWLWSPNRVDNLGRYPAIDGYYPGDAYVDWVGMTGYFRPGDKVATFGGTYDNTLRELRRVAPRKPILLAEVGATEVGGKKADWVRTFFPGLRRNPDVAGFIWFNYAVTDVNETTTGVTNDWRVNSTPASLSAFAAGLKASSYGVDHGKRLVLVPRSSLAPSRSAPVRTAAAPAPVPSPVPTPGPGSGPLVSHWLGDLAQRTRNGA